MRERREEGRGREKERGRPRERGRESVNSSSRKRNSGGTDIVGRGSNPLSKHHLLVGDKHHKVHDNSRKEYNNAAPGQGFPLGPCQESLRLAHRSRNWRENRRGSAENCPVVGSAEIQYSIPGVLVGHNGFSGVQLVDVYVYLTLWGDGQKNQSGDRLWSTTNPARSLGMFLLDFLLAEVGGG